MNIKSISLKSYLTFLSRNKAYTLINMLGFSLSLMFVIIITIYTEQEFGDCLFSLIALSGELGIDPASALDSALAKYKRRFDAKGRIGSGDN